MRLPSGKIRLFAVAGVLLVAVGAAVIVVHDPYLSDPAEAQAVVRRASTELADSRAEVRLAVAFTESEPQRFSGSGFASFEDSRAAVTYDFEDLLNAGGGFGHLDEFKVVFDGPTTYVEIFPGEKPWVSFDPDQVAYRDVERLREVVLSSPLAVPGLLAAMRDVTATAHGFFSDSATVSGVAFIDAIDEVPGLEALLRLGDELGLKSVSVDAEVSGGVVYSLTYAFDFPRIEGQQDDVGVRVTIAMEPSEAEGISPPPEDEVRPFKDFLDI